jgi:hypothetical protein
VRAILIVLGSAIVGYTYAAYQIERVAQAQIEQHIQQIEAVK